MMHQLMNALMLSCQRATYLIEKRQEAPLNVLERLQLSAHTSMCVACQAYQKQSAIIDRALDKNINQPTGKQQQLSGEAKKRIINKLEKE